MMHLGNGDMENLFYSVGGPTTVLVTVMAYWYAGLVVSSLGLSVTIASIHCAYPRRDGQAELVWVAWLNKSADYANPAWRRLTSLMCQATLRSSQTATASSCDKSEFFNNTLSLISDRLKRHAVEYRRVDLSPRLGGHTVANHPPTTVLLSFTFILTPHPFPPGTV